LGNVQPLLVRRHSSQSGPVAILEPKSLKQERDKIRQLGMGLAPTLFQSLAVGSTASRTLVMAPTVLSHRV
jgi:hypothetical protein